MIPRRIQPEVERRLGSQAAVTLLGPRQVGKTTLAFSLAERRPSVYLDLESPADHSRLAEPELYLADHEDELVILDEVQRVPKLFEVLRGVIDAGRRSGRGTGRFLILGSASIDLIRQTSETLAGRVSLLELNPIDVIEAGRSRQDDLWVRGGFPESLLASDDRASLEWRRDFIRTYLERDVPQLGSRIPAETLRRFWTMLAHRQGSLHNAGALASGLGVSGPTIARYLDLMVDLLLVRRLPAWAGNVGKRLVRSPKVYVRDSGLVHALLGIGSKEDLLGHPVVGMSWEGFAIENLIAVAGDLAEPSFYRSSGGAEMDLVLELGGGERWAIEVKRSAAPGLTRGFTAARAILDPRRSFVVYPGSERFRLAPGVEAIGLTELCEELVAVTA